MNAIGGTNLFSYCLNNPVNDVDPSGEFVISLLIIGAVIGLVVGAGASAISQGVTNGWDNIYWGQVAFDGFIGGVTGAIGGSGIGIIGSMIAGGLLGFAGSVGGDLILSGCDFNQVNWGKAAIMGVIGVGLGAWTGNGASNFKAMNASINAGKSWGSKAFINFGVSVADRGASQLARQTAALLFRNAVIGYQAKAITYVMLATLGSMVANNALGYFWTR